MNSSNQTQALYISRTLFNGGLSRELFIELAKHILFNFPENFSAGNSSTQKKMRFEKKNLQVASNSEMYFLVDTKTGTVLLGYHIKLNKLFSILSKESYEKLIQSLPNKAEKNMLLAFTLHEHQEVIEQKQQQMRLKPNTNSLNKNKILTDHSDDDFSTLIQTNVRDNHGVAFFNHHDHRGSYQQLAIEVPNLKQAGVTHIFIELSKHHFENIFNVFNETGDVAFLKQQLILGADHLYGALDAIIEFAKSAHHHGIKILPVDAIHYASRGDEGKTIIDYSKRLEDNIVMVHHINNYVHELKIKNFAFIGGIAHHEVANLLNINSVAFVSEKDVGIDRKAVMKKPARLPKDKMDLQQNKLLEKHLQHQDYIFVVPDDRHTIPFADKCKLFTTMGVSAALVGAVAIATYYSTLNDDTPTSMYK